MREWDGIVTGPARENGGARRELDEALAPEPEQCEQADEAGSGSPLSQQVRRHQREERAVETREPAIGGKLRLPSPHAERDRDRCRQQRTRRRARRGAFTCAAKGEEDADVPREVIAVEVRQVRRHQPPPLAALERAPVELQRGGDAGRQELDRAGGGCQRGHEERYPE